MIDYKKFLKSQKLRFKILQMLSWVPDKTMVKWQYRIKTGRKLDLKNPKSFNEKLQWLKLYDRKDEYTKMVDKYEAKKYVGDRIGKEYIIPTLGMYDRFEDIDFGELPNQFVIKCTHDSGGLVICKDKSELDKEAARKKITERLKMNGYHYGREWPYKNVKPRIIVEKYMDDGQGELKDYKFFCFNGEPRIILVCSERSKDLKETWFDENFKKLDIVESGHKNDHTIKKPKKLKEMMELSRVLANGMKFSRIDFYEINGKVFFGEITLFPASGFEKFDPEEWNDKLGSWIDLDEKDEASLKLERKK